MSKKDYLTLAQKLLDIWGIGFLANLDKGHKPGGKSLFDYLIFLYIIPGVYSLELFYTGRDGEKKQWWN